tara:strand:+ start:159 stop:437 length:279 start_codon:yes stop_codon:yes gene_type:complete
MNNLTVKDLEGLCNIIETMDIFHQKEILKILSSHKEKVTLNENKNGVLVNLTDVPEFIIDEINNYIKHVNKQKEELDCDENLKEKLKVNYFK